MHSGENKEVVHNSETNTQLAFLNQEVPCVITTLETILPIIDYHYGNSSSLRRKIIHDAHSIECASSGCYLVHAHIFHLSIQMHMEGFMQKSQLNVTIHRQTISSLRSLSSKAPSSRGDRKQLEG